jgi:hypothetical protein
LAAAAAVLAMIGAIVAHFGAAGSVPHLVRWTARSSLVLFLLAFLAGARGPLARSRHGFLVGLAASHLLHAGAIAAEALQTHGRNLAERGLAVIAAGAFGYLVIAMAAIKPESRWAGPGLYAVWAIFFFAYAKRALGAPVPFALPVLLLLAAIAWRLRAHVPLIGSDAGSRQLEDG